MIKNTGSALIILQEDGTISLHAYRENRTPQVKELRCLRDGSLARYLLLISISVLLIVLPASAETGANGSILQNATAPQVVQIGVYTVDFNNFNIADGTFSTNFYLTLESDSPVSINDFDIVNGQITSVDPLIDTPNEKSYRIFATATADPDIRLYPFDRHMLPIEIEPKLYDENRMVLVIQKDHTGLDPEADLPGWQIIEDNSRTISKSYNTGVTPYSRAAFNYGTTRDTTSTLLKFFLPILIIVIISLSSLMIRESSRLALNATMFIVAVFVHWRISDEIPFVAYATLLDQFMIVTYATIAMVIVSGILIQKFSESNNITRLEQVNRWSIRIIPVVSVVAYSLLFLGVLI